MSHEAWTLSHPIHPSWVALRSLHMICTLRTMRGRSMTSTLTALLCLRLCQGPWDQVQAGDVPKPSIGADPGPIVTNGSSVTIWCQAPLQASAYLLYKERGSEPWDTRTPQGSSNKAGFLIGTTTPSLAGLYQCAYYTTGDILSQRSDPLLLVVTGVGGAPSLAAQPSPVVASGENVSLLCSSNLTSGTFHLLKEGGADPPRHMEAEPRIHAWRRQAIFPLGPMSTSHGGTYRCYYSSSSYPNVWSQPSDPLELVVSGLKWYLIVLIGVSVALVLLLSLFLFLLRHQWHQSKGRTSDAVAKDTQPERDRQLDNPRAAPEDSQDVTYAQLKPLTLSQESSAPPCFPSEERPEEPSLYAALAMH
ncbi:leukocyte immunoglobulin-like receptor subfamily B member 4 isoform X2 [Myotis daubentonii]|uniref:leukocyte immunoglobulin-like receptor subfamily B member 4 isoform X2 n=1 Tax=Myotis daubentonii TaxID=98922 RepID=UPI002873D278|nr:leukocyte immunoglobulin-like receptor subfamily B member 4 isoform X2 [Myotis daubentonii]